MMSATLLFVEVRMSKEEIAALDPELWKIKTRKRLQAEMLCDLQAVAYSEDKDTGAVTLRYKVL